MQYRFVSSCIAAPPRPTLPAATLLLLGLLPACGRIGVELLPESIVADDAPVLEGDAGAEAGAALTDAGSGTDPCLATCRNPHGSAQCSEGKCGLTCSAGFADCDGDARNGCETNLRSDPRHCGECARSCAADTQICQDGTCERSPCPTGRGECDDDATLLCETDLTSSAQSCGFCGNTCIAAHGTGACQQRSCVIASCEPGYADCNRVGGDGCEASLSSVEHCGACGRSCPADEGTPSCSAGVCAVSCSLTGVFALKLSIPTSWPRTITLSAGSGVFTLWGLLELTQNGTALRGAFTPCGERVPDFRAAPLINERYGVLVPDALFDRIPALPSVPASAALSQLAPGARFTLARTAFMFGAQLGDPVADAWPSATALRTLDADADGRLAVSAPYKSGSDYTAPPANNLGTVRAQSSYLATRLVFALEGVLNRCTQSSGSVTTQDVDSHTLGCRVVGNARDCSALEANHLDRNTPNFVPSTGSYELVKLSAPGCASARAALP